MAGCEGLGDHKEAKFCLFAFLVAAETSLETWQKNEEVKVRKKGARAEEGAEEDGRGSVGCEGVGYGGLMTGPYRYLTTGADERSPREL